ncbi:phage NrS-1 polymerase family protein [Fundicoccus sp. Sow4_H7]|uniref:phage NrS-1 polymerase family protein n=1 Tax=Fundicoccus sp. Sow4_H7 TaxID=3438784 RepID=UPI003F8EB624
MEQKIDITGYEAVPDELKDYPNWIVWKREIERDSDGNIKVDENGESKYTKVPYDPVAGAGAKARTTNPDTWHDFNTIIEHEHRFDGLGFVFTNTPFIGVDLDNIKDEITAFQNGNETGIVGEFYNQLQTYAEISPSDNGLHFIIKGELPQGRKRKEQVEMYDKTSPRYFTVTGNQLGDINIINPNGTELIKPLHNKYLGNETQSKNDIPIPDPEGNSLTIEELTKKASNAKNGDKFKALFFDGDTSQHNGDDSSADQALINMMWWWTNGDPDKVDEWFRKSALYRPKWDEQRGEHTYGFLTSYKAYESFKGGYTGKNNNNFSLTINQNKDNWSSRKWELIANKQNLTPVSEGSSTLIDGNGVKWVEKDGGKDKPSKLVLIRNYINHEKMASLAVDLIQNEFTEYIEYFIGDKTEIVDDFFMSDMYRKVSEIYTDLPQRDMLHIVNNLGVMKKYHPIKELIESVKWDKTERVETFFIDFFGLEDTSYYREATRKWFIGAIARVYDPGVKFDSTIVLRGKQGTGKTTAITKLAMDSEYYVSLSERIDKDVLLNINSGWLIELEELEFLKNNSVGAVKKFLTATQDKYRMPYGRKEKFYKRHSVFIATINDKNFLKDRTGNRRFVPFMIHDNAEPELSVFNDLTMDYVHQLWAEALEYYSIGESLVISEESEKAFDILRGEVEEVDITKDTLLEMLDLEIPHNYYSMTLEQKRSYLSGESGVQSDLVIREDITAKEILTEFFGRDIDGDLRGNTVAREVNEIMLNLPNWKVDTNIKRTSPDGKTRRQRGFKRVD